MQTRKGKAGGGLTLGDVYKQEIQGIQTRNRMT